MGDDPVVSTLQMSFSKTYVPGMTDQLIDEMIGPTN